MGKYQINKEVVTFKEAYLRLQVTINQVNDWVESWHNSSTEKTFIEYLGLTAEENEAFVRSDRALEELLLPQIPVYRAGDYVEGVTEDEVHVKGWIQEVISQSVGEKTCEIIVDQEVMAYFKVNAVVSTNNGVLVKAFYKPTIKEIHAL